MADYLTWEQLIDRLEQARRLVREVRDEPALDDLAETLDDCDRDLCIAIDQIYDREML